VRHNLIFNECSGKHACSLLNDKMVSNDVFKLKSPRGNEAKMSILRWANDVFRLEPLIENEAKMSILR